MSKQSPCRLAGLMLFCAAGVTQADIISPDPYMLGGNRQYQQTNAPMLFHVAAIGDIALQMDWTWNGPAHMPAAPGAGPSYGECDGTVALRIGLNGLPPGEPVWGILRSSFTDTFTGIGADGETSYYDTEMLSLDLHATTTLNDGTNLDIMMRPKPHKGIGGAWFRHYFIIKGGDSVPGESPELFQINSFFDVFAELSLDGGQTWTDSDGAAHMELIGPSVPAPGAAGLLALGGALAARRRRA